MKKISFLFLNLIVVSISLLFITQSVSAQKPPTEIRFEAVVTAVKKETIIDNDNKVKEQYIYTLKGINTQYKNKIFSVNSQNITQVNTPEYKMGDRVIVSLSKDLQGKEMYFVQDYVRKDSLIWLALIFILATLIIGGKTGLGSLVGMGFSFLIIFNFILPQIMSGKDPILITTISSVFIIPIMYYLSHGFNSKTHIAIISTIFTLILSGYLANGFIDSARLSGLSSEEAGFLQAAKPNLINMQGLLLAGIIIGIIGVIDDITISQAAIVFQLKEASRQTPFMELYTRAMNVGKDHIASMVNTLILVYAGASMPLLLLFIDNPSPFSQVVNHEIIATEIVRTLVASICLIFAVPITTFLTALFVDYRSRKNKTK